MGITEEIKDKTLLMTGGHAVTTAIAIAQELIEKPNRRIFNKIYWIGTSKPIEGRKDLPIEFSVFQRLGVSVFGITAGKLQTKFTRWTIPALIKFPIGLIQAGILLRKINPDVILSFGGSAALPVALWGKMMHIPFVIHEQTTAAGRSNRVCSILADKIALARTESEIYFKNKNTEITGNPLMAQIIRVNKTKIANKIPTIYISGGSRGSQRINHVVDRILPELITHYRVIHQTGPVDFNYFNSKRQTMEKTVSGRYEVYAYIDPMKINDIYQQTDVMVARAGANTVAEIVYLKIPSLLVPIPWTYLDEQTKNASWAKTIGIAEILSENKLNPKLLLNMIAYLVNHRYQYINRLRNNHNPDEDAAAKVVNLLKDQIK